MKIIAQLHRQRVQQQQNLRLDHWSLSKTASGPFRDDAELKGPAPRPAVMTVFEARCPGFKVSSVLICGAAIP